LPPALRYDDAYQHEDFWRAFLAWEHEAHRTIHVKRDFQPGKATPESKDENEDDEEMEDVVSPTIVELEVLVPDDYDEDAATPAALE
jgi:hypothetical protein